MPYTGDPANVPADEVRFLLGDIAEPYRLTDGEVDYLLTKRNAVVGHAAYDGARMLVAKYTGMPNKQIGATLTDFGQLVRQYDALAKDLARRYLVGTPTATGLATTDDPLWSDQQWSVDGQ